MNNSLYLSSFAILEPVDNLYLYYPGWLNVWEAHLYKQALKSTLATGWGLKRFGTAKDIYAREMIRKPHYSDYIKAMEDAAETALQNLPAKERMYLFKSRTAFIYVDAWGETGVFENISSALHTSFIDTLPKNVLKKFAISDLSCKIRGEKQSLMQAVRLAQDYIGWGIFDFVIICAAYRAIPFLVFSEGMTQTSDGRQDGKINVNIERTGCFIFSKRESSLKIACGPYLSGDSHQVKETLFSETNSIDLFACSWLPPALLPGSASRSHAVIDLVERYGHSGCLMPALGWEYLTQHAQSSGTMRTIVADNVGGYNYFDTEY